MGDTVNNDYLGVLYRITSRVKTFKGGVDLKLSKYILENTQEVIALQSLYELAERSGVSESSIVRY